MTRGTDTLTRKIGLRLRATRRTAGLTLGQLADRTNGRLIASRISNYEQGLRRLGRDPAAQLAEAFGMVTAPTCCAWGPKGN